MTSIPMQDNRPHTTTPVAVQILGMILFAGFAIPVTIIALNIFWPAGVALALVLGWRGTFAFSGNAGMSSEEVTNLVRSLTPDGKSRQTGNASFDAYRDDMLDRLEMEQENFDSFLDRLRDAKDKAEFDTFMDERARLQNVNEP